MPRSIGRGKPMIRTNQQGRFARAGYYRSRWKAVALRGVAASSMAKIRQYGNPTRVHKKTRGAYRSRPQVGNEKTCLTI